MSPQHALVPNDEPVLVEGVTSYLTGKMSSVFGRAYLTPSRLTFKQYPMWTLMFGAIGLLLARYGVVKPKTKVFELHRDAMVEIKRGKWGFNTKIIEVQSRDGMHIRLAVDDWAKWRAAWPELPA